MDGSDKYVGRILDNRYEILERIGTGGMALVYKARCHRLNRMVAIKILKDDLADDEEFRRRFNTESQAVAMLSHPNIVAVYDVSHSGKTEYIVMELIEGISLKQYINRKGLLTWKEALHFSTQITKALSHAHSRGIIHRDIKPHNIMILKDGSVKVADFGIARLLTVENTLTQEALGSVHYISPEQAKGGYVDARSDIYSVGVVMYEMLTSRLPFVGDSAVSIAIQHISAMPLMPRDINPDIPAGLEDITMHAMEPELSLRFTTADEMLADLEEFRKNPSIMFNYTASDPNNRISGAGAAGDDGNATKVVPTGANARADRGPTGKQRGPKKQEMTPEEYREAKKRAASTSTLIGIFSVIAVIVVVLIFMWNYLLKDLFAPPEREMITIHNFVNSRYEDVIRDYEFEELYNFIMTEANSDEYPAGVIIRQRPPADRQQNAPAQGRKIDIELTVSLGEPEQQPYEMPNLINKHYTEAKNQLENLGLGLIVELEPVVSDSDPRNIVIETIPREGIMLSRGNMVIIRYSAGPQIKTATVPNLVGKTMAELESAFETLSLIPDPRYFVDEAPAGTVILIPRVGEEVQENTRIVVHISAGPPTPPSPTMTETPDPSPTPTPTTPPPTDTPPTETPSTEPPPTETPTSDPPPTDTSPPPTSPPPTDDENPSEPPVQ